MQQQFNTHIHPSSLTGPWGVQPVLDVEDLLIFRASMRLLTDLIIFGNFLLQTETERQTYRERERNHNIIFSLHMKILFPNAAEED